MSPAFIINIIIHHFIYHCASSSTSNLAIQFRTKSKPDHTVFIFARPPLPPNAMSKPPWSLLPEQNAYSCSQTAGTQTHKLHLPPFAFTFLSAGPALSLSLSY